MRKDWVWHDGTPLSSEDIKIDFYCKMLMGWWEGKVIKHIETPDKHTVVFHCRRIPKEFLLFKILADTPILVQAKKYKDFIPPNIEELAERAYWLKDAEALKELETWRKKLEDHKPPLEEYVGLGPYTIAYYTDTEILFKKFEKHLLKKCIRLKILTIIIAFTILICL